MARNPKQPETPEQAAARRARMARLQAQVEKARAREQGLEPEDIGLSRPTEELDPYLKAQLGLVQSLIDASRDADGVATKKGPLELFFAWANDPNLDISDRLKAAKELARYTHKPIPSSLTIDDGGTGEEQHDVSAIQAVGNLLSRLTGSKHQPTSTLIKAREKR